MTVDVDAMDFGDDITDAFLSNLTGEPSEKTRKEDEAELPDDQDGSKAFKADESDDDQTEDGAETAAKSDDPEDAEVTWGEGDKAGKAKLRDLREAFEAREANARAAEETTALRTKATEETTKATTVLQAMIKKAGDRWKPYENLDFMALSRDPSISQDDFVALRKEAQEALTDYRYLTTELTGLTAAQEQASRASFQAEQQACVKELQDPERGIKGFNGDLYNGLLDHAQKAYGAPKEALLRIAQPWAIKALHDAMLYRQGAAKADAQIAKVVNKATKVLRPASGSSSSSSEAVGMKAAMKNLRANPSSSDAAADAFLASFGE